jgi:selenium metabolism protein YedF
MKTLDVTGKKCPMPLIETKKALMESEAGESLTIFIDSETSVKNVTHYLKDNNIPVTSRKNGDVWELSVNRGEAELEKTEPEAYCEPEVKAGKNYVVVMAKNRIGEGSDELGEKLVGPMLESLKAQDTLPSKMIFMNAGIHLVTNNSPVIPQLKELELSGVELISCGTCLNYFNKENDLAIGRISNMFEIVEAMRTTGKVISI